MKGAILGTKPRQQAEGSPKSESSKISPPEFLKRKRSRIGSWVPEKLDKYPTQFPINEIKVNHVSNSPEEKHQIADPRSLSEKNQFTSFQKRNKINMRLSDDAMSVSLLREYSSSRAEYSETSSEEQPKRNLGTLRRARSELSSTFSYAELFNENITPTL